MPRVVRSNAVAPGELQDSADFDKLTRDSLRIWIKSSGWTRGTASIKRADLIDLARRIQSNPTLVRSTSLTFDKVRSREDLLRLSKASLQKMGSISWLHGGYLNSGGDLKPRLHCLGSCGRRR